MIYTLKGDSLRKGSINALYKVVTNVVNMQFVCSLLITAVRGDHIGAECISLRHNYISLQLL